MDKIWCLNKRNLIKGEKSLSLIFRWPIFELSSRLFLPVFLNLEITIELAFFIIYNSNFLNSEIYINPNIPKYNDLVVKRLLLYSHTHGVKYFVQMKEIWWKRESRLLLIRNNETSWFPKSLKKLLPKTPS